MGPGAPSFYTQEAVAFCCSAARGGGGTLLRTRDNLSARFIWWGRGTVQKQSRPHDFTSSPGIASRAFRKPHVRFPIRPPDWPETQQYPTVIKNLRAYLRLPIPESPFLLFSLTVRH